MTRDEWFFGGQGKNLQEYYAVNFKDFQRGMTEKPPLLRHAGYFSNAPEPRFLLCVFTLPLPALYNQA